jgi:hypothetical protein
MKIKNGRDEITITAQNISLKSADRYKIKLPYLGELTGDILTEAYLTALNDCYNERDILLDMPFESVVERIDTYINLHMQPRTYGAVIELDITAANGKRTVKKVVADAHIGELLALTEAFIRRGSGIDAEYRDLIERQYNALFDKLLKRVS